MPESEEIITPVYGPNIPVAIGSGVAVAFIIIGLLLAPGPDRWLNRVLIVTAVICLWLNWIMIFVSQMYPILVPVDDRYPKYISQYNEFPPMSYMHTPNQ
eukprot:TRINITY_DN14080_c0_g1_i1.p1 TRINITY_DN14080_c0_g1~~TRINITY_DN14080_c0_g1_i1.p1  ORF type:complete len:100 (+),score=8.32 TRINITY_DN14080_c0_g1_i1:104-403(+)